uniref:Uncharacterized protein n=1 Tax=Populus alba TaxID=43335 RepID=A0A4U5Q464_POPAL|nr:hypothetical protein D5086_0000156960 [Populus alba]
MVLQKQKSSRERRVKEEKLDDVVKQKRRVVALCRHATQKHIRERDSSATQPMITMSLLSWNCHGLGHPGAVQFLCKLLKLETPEIVFSSKTKLKNKEFEGVEREDFFPQ